MISNTNPTVEPTPKDETSEGKISSKVKRCGFGYAFTDEIMNCGYQEGHDRVMKPYSKNKTLFDHGDIDSDTWWNEDSSFSRGERETSDERTLDYEAEDELFVVGDPVNHPPHYGGADNLYEAIKVIEAWDLGFCLGNAVKYISRAGQKSSATKIEDLRKARWYLDREIERMS